MIEGVITSALETLITQGSGWIVSVILGAWAYILDRRVQTMQSLFDAQTLAANRAVQEQYEKRLDEFRELLEVMGNSTSTVKAMHGSLTATSEAINQLAQGFSKLMSEFQSHQNRWDDKGGGMAKQLEDIRHRLETLQREVRS